MILWNMINGHDVESDSLQVQKMKRLALPDLASEIKQDQIIDNCDDGACFTCGSNHTAERFLGVLACQVSFIHKFAFVKTHEKNLFSSARAF